jgi:hypothetical protein
VSTPCDIDMSDGVLSPPLSLFLSLCVCACVCVRYDVRRLRGAGGGQLLHAAAATEWPNGWAYSLSSDDVLLCISHLVRSSYPEHARDVAAHKITVLFTVGHHLV